MHALPQLWDALADQQVTLLVIRATSAKAECVPPAGRPPQPDLGQRGAPTRRLRLEGWRPWEHCL